MRRASFVIRPVLAAALLAVAACTDRTPTQTPPAPTPPGGPAAAALRCEVDVRAGTLACKPMGPQTAPGVSAVILGGQGTHVRLTSSGTSYDAGTAILRSDVTVQNLTAQALGTGDGGTAAPLGVMVFFHSGPDVTGGTGTVTVENADGLMSFTGSNQPYFRYDGPLPPGATSEAREWRFSVPTTVSTFAFTVYVAAGVRAEPGYVSMSPLAPSLLVGDTQRVAATVRGVTGSVLAGEPVTWMSSDPDVASVDSAGVVTGLAPGTAMIIATSGSREGSVTVHVAADVNDSRPEVGELSFFPATVHANGADSLKLYLSVRDPLGVTSIRFTLFSPNGLTTRTCFAGTVNRVSGTQFDGVYECRLTFPTGSWTGAWRVWEVAVGTGPRTRVVSPAQLIGAGVQPLFQVTGGPEDTTAPTIGGFTFSPDTAAIGEDTARVDITAADAGTGIEQASVFLSSSPVAFQTASCTTFAPFTGTRASGTFRCRLPFRIGSAPGDMRVDSVRVRDANGNSRVLTTADLQGAGYPTTLVLVEETTPPTLTAFSFSPDSVRANGVDSVQVTATATDAASGVWLVQAKFSKVGGTPDQTRECTGIGPAAPSRTASCALRFGAADAGTWRLDEIAAHDDAENARILDTAQAQAAGYATEFVVTAP